MGYRDRLRYVSLHFLPDWESMLIFGAGNGRQQLFDWTTREEGRASQIIGFGQAELSCRFRWRQFMRARELGAKVVACGLSLDERKDGQRRGKKCELL